MQMVTRTHLGLIRVRNEDWIGCDAKKQFAVLADGMGGLFAGDVASRTAGETVAAALDEATTITPELLLAACEHAHQTVIDTARELEMGKQMGTTLVVWAATPSGWAAAHVGDSRLYRWHNGILDQLTEDHTLAQRMRHEGSAPAGIDIDKEYGHILTQAVGLLSGIEPGICSGVLPAGRFLLCSDGLSEAVGNVTITDLIAQPDLSVAASQLMQAAIDEGGRDNISLVLIDT